MCGVCVLVCRRWCARHSPLLVPRLHFSQAFFFNGMHGAVNQPWGTWGPHPKAKVRVQLSCPIVKLCPHCCCVDFVEG